MHSVADLEIDQMVSLVWWIFTRDSEPEERERFKARLWVPPTTNAPIPVESPWSAENENAAFESLLAETTGRE
jgi:hypothetical protein